MAKTILLADDSVTIQKVVELTFMDEDYQVVAVGDGAEAVAKLEATAPDLVIADVHMPGADGYEVCRQVKTRLPGTPVLLLVGTFEPFDEATAAAAGADEHLKKPFDSQDLLRQVESLTAARASSAAPPAAPAAPPAAPAAPPATPAAPPAAPAESLFAGEQVERHPTAATEINASPFVDDAPPFELDQGSVPEFELEPDDDDPPPFELDADDDPPPFELDADDDPPPFELDDAPPAAPAASTTDHSTSELGQMLAAPAPPQAQPAAPVPAAPQPAAPAPAAPKPAGTSQEVRFAPPDPEPSPDASEPAWAETAAAEPSLEMDDTPAEAVPVASEPPATPPAAPESAPAAAAPAASEPAAAVTNGGGPLSDEDVDRIARRVAQLIGDTVLRDVAWEVVPDLAEVVIRERLRQLESQVE